MNERMRERIFLDRYPLYRLFFLIKLNFYWPNCSKTFKRFFLTIWPNFWIFLKHFKKMVPHSNANDRSLHDNSLGQNNLFRSKSTTLTPAPFHNHPQPASFAIQIPVKHYSPAVPKLIYRFRLSILRRPTSSLEYTT